MEKYQFLSKRLGFSRQLRINLHFVDKFNNSSLYNDVYFMSEVLYLWICLLNIIIQYTSLYKSSPYLYLQFLLDFIIQNNEVEYILANPT
jgi:hypothetical protein